ncbi:MAG: SAM-dependent methyltransferase [Thiotrichales bacterium]|jgi:SAM-dependent MidA family methyltransferase|nr:SAM-dependent methyltransferase [Thiotrichales bacterium]MBT3854480.1 SAM-dependent methyltransferase [Thiotrichales bacterium]MBT5500136.1 SAM-dependent methyltransferase [Thiotrichales bacterium]MBT5984486.1 SAM-dependent methyltransferase [Thiotrichales bacterium]MBT6772158.1 SAM-dependent methyltransferase [Thiotrichales bacterium]
MNLEDIISKTIKDNNNPIGFDVFMNLALYHHQFGYYRSNKTIFGHKGDFITAPETSDLFGFCLARQCKQVLNNGNILEFGAGSGILAAQILFELGRQNSLPAKYFIIELSAQLKKIQQGTLKRALPEIYDRVEWLTELPSKFKGVVVANEVLDAFPIKRVTLLNNQFYELGVEYADNCFQWKRFEQPYSQSKVPHADDLPEGYTTEISNQSDGWLKSIYDLMSEGTVLLIDYGMSRAEYFHSQRSDGTLKCFHKHKSNNNPFIHIGDQDITASVNFTDIAKSSIDAGFKVDGYSTQSMFLISLGIENFLISEENEENKIKLAQEIKQLVMPGAMGEVFKVMALTKKQSVKLDGFKEQNLTERL